MGRPQLGFPRLRVIVGRAAGITIGPDHTPPWRNMMRSCQTGNFARLPQSAVQRIGRELVHSVACAVNSVRVMAASPCGYRVHAALTSSSLLPCSNLGPACPLCCRYSFPACGCEYRQPNQFGKEPLSMRFAAKNVANRVRGITTVMISASRSAQRLG
jgi:hypothetical protein